MILPSPKDALHKAMMYRMLISILDNKNLSSNLYFKGGTCAAMLGFLDRFSIDLDFDLKKGADKKEIRENLNIVFEDLNFTIKEQAKNELYYVLKYDAPKEIRNTLKLSIIDKVIKTNIYKPQFLEEIKRYAICQTVETMFANKLVAVTDRYKRYKTIAGRDLYDIHHFFINGYGFNKKVIEERIGKTAEKYLTELINFIEKKFTVKQITEDLSYLLPPDKFKAIRKTLIAETLSFLKSISTLTPT